MKTLELQLGVTKIVVLRGFGTDKVILHTSRPSPFPPEVTSEPLTVQFDTRHGYAEEYVRTTFGVEVDEVIDRDAPSIYERHLPKPPLPVRVKSHDQQERVKRVVAPEKKVQFPGKGPEKR
jgi:hypothetical protein